MKMADWGGVGADLRAATSLDSEVAAQGDSGHTRCSHIKTAFSFIKVVLTFQGFLAN